jgi:hypothetical protein
MLDLLSQFHENHRRFEGGHMPGHTEVTTTFDDDEPGREMSRRLASRCVAHRLEETREGPESEVAESE